MHVLRSRPIDGTADEIALGGRLYAAGAAELRAALAHAADRARIVVDATALEAVDAIAVQAFVDTVRRLRPHGGALVFFGVRRSVADLFDLVGLARVVSIVASREDALRGAA